MAFTNSSLISVTKLSPNNSGERIYPITRITPHCVVGQCSAETIGNINVLHRRRQRRRMDRD